jgi:hypothetical protein
LAGISILVAIRNGLVVVPVVNRRGRPRRPFISIISIGGAVDGRRWPAAPDTAITIAPRERPPPGSIGSVRIIAVVTAIAPVRIIAVVTAVAPVTIAPLDILAFDIATLVDNA